MPDNRHPIQIAMNQFDQTIKRALSDIEKSLTDLDEIPQVDQPKRREAPFNPMRTP